MNHKILKMIFPLLILFFVWGCSDVRNDLTQPKEIDIHQEGISNTSSPNFHATKFVEENWNVESCQQCHGSDYSGGTVEVSCNTCHSNPHGPEACNTCHGDFSDKTRIAPPTDLHNNTSTTQKGVGAHTSHIYENKLSQPVSCYDCHTNQRIENESYIVSHIDGLPAEISIPGYSFSENKCSNTYCHGNFTYNKNESTNNFGYINNSITGNNFTPLWTKVDGTQAACGTCHGLPPAGHIAAELKTCYTCHPGVVDVAGNIADLSQHIDGIIQLADERYFADVNCDNCHGNDTTQPFTGLGGTTSKSDRGVALHDEHVFTNSIGAKISCEDCHIVPQTYKSEGHFDATVTAEVNFREQQGIVNTPSYDANLLQCSNTYCHGNFKYEKITSLYPWAYTATTITGNSKSVLWKSPANDVACGSCHGLPPEGHIDVEITECADCHAGVVDAAGNIINQEKHINGVANVFGN